MKEFPRVSACVVLYRSGEQALETLQCLEASRPRPEIFVVDNHSGDGLAARVAERFPDIRLLPQAENLGFGRGNNVVLPLLHSEYHLLCNPDVTFPPELLDRMTAWMDAHPEAVILTPRVMNQDGTEQFLPKGEITVRHLLGGRLERLGGCFRRWRREFTLADARVTGPRKVHFATGCFLLIRTEAFRTLRGFDPRFFLYQEDSDLSRRAEQLGDIVYHPDMVVTHAWARENTRTLRGNLRQQNSGTDELSGGVEPEKLGEKGDRYRERKGRRRQVFGDQHDGR
mgnify:CR=1 FL=1